MTLKTIDINELASIGAIADEPGYQLAPEAWTLTNNMRILDGGMRRLFGWSQIFGSGAMAEGPYFIMYVSSSAQPWWLWASLDKIYVYDSSTSTTYDITNVGHGYSATDASKWNGTVFGGIPILNEGAHIPQYWSAYDHTQKMQDITNFPANTTCKIMRSFGPFLLALNTTESGTNHPHRVLWSTEAVPGSLPGSWDVADPTKDAGRNDLPDSDSGIIVDGLGLQGAFYVYKEASTWRIRFIGGRFIFTFEPFLETVGALSTRCVCLAGDGQHHVVVTQDDMLIHNGNQATPLLERRFKRYLFNQIDTTNYQLSFMFSNPVYDEIWFCYPVVGTSLCNRALIYNWKHDRFTESDIDFQCASLGVTQTTTGGLWSAATEAWNADPNPWLVQQRRRTVIGNPTTQKIHLFDNGTLRDGAAYTGTLQRTSLGVIGRKRTGEWIEDFRIVKMVNRLWPKVTGGPINIRVGYQRLVNGPVTWRTAQSFDPNTDGGPALGMTVDGMLGSGRAVAVEFASTNDFRIDGYKIDMATLGQF